MATSKDGANWNMKLVLEDWPYPNTPIPALFRMHTEGYTWFIPGVVNA